MKLTEDQFRAWLGNFIDKWSAVKTEQGEEYVSMGRCVLGNLDPKPYTFFTFGFGPRHSTTTYHKTPFIEEYICENLLKNSLGAYWAKNARDGHEHYSSSRCQHMSDAALLIRKALTDEP